MAIIMAPSLPLGLLARMLPRLLGLLLRFVLFFMLGSFIVLC